jgi:hypothetical protein
MGASVKDDLSSILGCDMRSKRDWEKCQMTLPIGRTDMRNRGRHKNSLLWIPAAAQVVLALMAVSFLVASPGNAFAWTITADFESGSVGAWAVGADAFHTRGNSSGKFEYSNAQAHTGQQSAKVIFLQGQVSSTPWPIFIVPKGSVPLGGELWVRAYYYFPSGFSFSDNDPTRVFDEVKWIRIRRTDTHTIDMYIHNVGSGRPVHRCEDCPSPGRIGQSVNVPPYAEIPRDKWVALEMYVLLRADQGGIVRIWVDGELKVEKIQSNAPNSTEITQIFFHGGYWNLGVPQDQFHYLDDIVITTDPAAANQRDTFGNRMIGTMPTSADKTPPAAPTGVGIVTSPQSSTE